MKKAIAIIVAMIFFFGLPIMTYAGQKDKRYKKNNRGQYERVYKKEHPRNHPRGKKYGHYKHKRQERYRHHKYQKHYTWNGWSRHRHEYRRYHHKRYHHDDNGYLMFSFCQDRDAQVCFSISID